MMKMWRGLLCGFIVLLCLITANAFAQTYNYAAGFRWNGSQLQHCPDLFHGATIPPGSSPTWYNAFFNPDGTLYFDGGGTSIPITGATSQGVVDAIGSGGSGPSPSPTPSPDSDIDLSSLYLGRDFGNSVNSNREVTDVVEEGRLNSKNPKEGTTNEGRTTTDEQGHTYKAPVEIGSWALYFGLSSSYDEYRYKSLRRLTGLDAYGRLWRTTARVHAVKDRLTLSTSLSYEEYWGTGLMDSADYSALSLEFVPQYYLLQQDVDLIDLAAFLSIGGEHTWFDDSRLEDDQLDFWHYGAGLGAGKTFRFGDFWLVYLYQCHKNADGDDGVTGDGELGTHRLGLTYTALITEHIPFQASIYYNHYSQLPKELDSDDFEGAVRVGWLGENWSLLLGYRQLLDSSDFRNWGVDCKFTYLW